MIKKQKLMWLVLFLAGIAQAQDIDLQVELMNRVGTETSRKGDLVSARVLSPADLRFDAGSKFVLAASSRSGASLASLGSSKLSVESAPAATASPATAAAPATTAPPAAPQSPAGPTQPNFTVLKDEFMPGENTLFYDDFTDMGPGDAPPHFKVRGASPDLMGSGDMRQLNATAKGTLIPNLTSLPKNFTYELVIQTGAKGRADSNLILISKGKQILHWWMSAQQSAQPKYLDLIVSLRAPYSELGRKRVPVNLDQPVKLALWIQNGRMRSYINGEKALDFNQVELPPIDGVEIENGVLGAGASLGYRMVRFAESTPDFSQAISSSGRYIARGILFDTDSDVIKPESAPVIRQIAQGLEKNPNLKVLIEGHTDSVGNAAHNLDLSKRRAEAVKSVLAAQFNIDAARLTTAGLGSTKPVDTNDTPQGRSQNRRVELVRQ